MTDLSPPLALPGLKLSIYKLELLAAVVNLLKNNLGRPPILENSQAFLATVTDSGEIFGHQGLRPFARQQLTPTAHFQPA